MSTSLGFEENLFHCTEELIPIHSVSYLGPVKRLFSFYFYRSELSRRNILFLGIPYKSIFAVFSITKLMSYQSTNLFFFSITLWGRLISRFTGLLTETSNVPKT